MHWFRALFCALIVIAVTATNAQAILTVVCDPLSCLDATDHQTINILLRIDETVPVKLHWRSSINPVPEKFQATLYAGNPATHDNLPKRGVLNFEQKGNFWQASYEFSGVDLGRGTFLAIVILHRADADETVDVNRLHDRTILDWRAFRLLTEAERRRKRAIPKPTSEWSVHVQPALLRVTSGRGELPRYRGGDRKAWWSLADAEGNYTDLDIDGVHNGVPGLGIQVATPWHTRADDQTWKDQVFNNLKSIDGHEVRFGVLKWIERPDRTVNLGGKVSPIFLRHYYTVISLYTNASMRSFTEAEIGANNLFANPRYFSHETSARLKVTKDPRFWASYSRLEYGADIDLLNLLKEQFQRQDDVPGLTMIQTDDGDGGDVTYHVGFYAYVHPWEVPPAHSGQHFRAGLMGIDVVAARAGIGRFFTPGSTGKKVDPQEAWCQVVRCRDTGHMIDLNEPPKGFRATSAVARLRTLSGNLPIVTEQPIIVERDPSKPAPDTPPTVGLPNLPDRARFGVSANLRSGAVLQKAAWGNIRNITPINSYAQFVVKLTVAMHPATDLVVNNDAHIPSTVEFDTTFTAPKPQDFFAWLEKHYSKLKYVAIIVGVLALFMFVPGLRRFVSALFSVFASALERVAAGLEPRK